MPQLFKIDINFLHSSHMHLTFYQLIIFHYNNFKFCLIYHLQFVILHVFNFHIHFNFNSNSISIEKYL